MAYTIPLSITNKDFSDIDVMQLRRSLAPHICVCLMSITISASVLLMSVTTVMVVVGKAAMEMPKVLS